MRTVKEIARRNQDQIFAKTWSKVDQQVVLETKHDTRSQTVTETTCQPPHDHEAMTGARVSGVESMWSSKSVPLKQLQAVPCLKVANGPDGTRHGTGTARVRTARHGTSTSR
ncbi:hypothetical protein WN944_021830 [Citrus x changshan-huyou]|uniref:Uncharacterized protein n=1 Tax=Citrus x changshan-huyou TaxID=2935761 RepID=A0AAP0MXJ1_9ROSI